MGEPPLVAASVVERQLIVLGGIGTCRVEPNYDCTLTLEDVAIRDHEDHVVVHILGGLLHAMSVEEARGHPVNRFSRYAEDYGRIKGALRD